MVSDHERQRALTQKQTLWGGGALEHGDLGLLEHGSERRGALVSDAVVAETAKERQSGDGERAGVSAGADTKANALGASGALELLEHAIFLDAARYDDAGGDTEPLV